MTTILSSAFTVADLEAMPDDGKRYERSPFEWPVTVAFPVAELARPRAR